MNSANTAGTKRNSPNIQTWCARWRNLNPFCICLLEEGADTTGGTRKDVAIREDEDDDGASGTMNTTRGFGAVSMN